MKISDKWLRTFLDTDLSSEKLGIILTDLGLEIEGIENFETIKGSLKGIVVGKILTCEQHPNADKLKVTTVDIGGERPLPIVCGAPNVAAGQKVAVATVGTTLYSENGEAFKIKKAKLRGEPSEGMICAEDEIGLGNSHEGIMVLPEDYEVGKPLSDYHPIVEDEVYEIGLTPNRADAMSHYGVARDLHAYLSVHQQKHLFHKIDLKSIKGEGTHDFEIEIEDQQLVPRYLGAVINNLKIEASPDWIQNYLKAIGLKPINNVVDITNYILHTYGQPLHAFDARKIKEHKVKIGVSHRGTKFKSLDGEVHTLNGTEIMIKDGEENPMCIGGVFGGEGSGVSEGTTSIFLESAYFNPVAVRKAAKAHGLNTDASFRFERGIDPNITKIALLEAVQLLKEIAGGVLLGDILEFYPEKIEDFPVIFRYSKLDQILGTGIPHETVKSILKSLDIKIVNEIKDGLELLVPAYRADVTREIDVVEEILRVYGYNNIEGDAKISFTPTALDLEDGNALENFWARQLQGNGFYEVLNNSLTRASDTPNTVTLLNPLSKELSSMRSSLLDGILGNADFNIKRKQSDLKLFEFGKIYHKTAGEYQERKQLALLLTGNNLGENWIVPKSATNFYHLKGYVQLLLDKLGLATEERGWEDARFSDGLEITSQGEILARIGIVSKNTLKEADVEQSVFYAEIEFETCQKLRKKGNFKFVEISKFNSLRRDLALLLDRSVSYNSLLQATKGSSKYLQNVNLFDVYEGKNLPKGKKSYALSFELLDKEKTLEENEINAIMEKLINTYRKNFNAELRG